MPPSSKRALQDYLDFAPRLMGGGNDGPRQHAQGASKSEMRSHKENCDKEKLVVLEGTGCKRTTANTEEAKRVMRLANTLFNTLQRRFVLLPSAWIQVQALWFRP